MALRVPKAVLPSSYEIVTIRAMQQAMPAYEYPRVYRPKGPWRLAMQVLGAIPIIGGSIGLWYFGTGHETHAAAVVIMLIFCTAFLLMGAYLLFYTLRAQVTLRQDDIELTELTSTTTLRRDQILGYRSRPGSQGPPTLILIPREGAGKKLTIASMFAFDQAFHDWISTLPNLDVRDAEEEQKDIESNPELGTTPAERESKINEARTVCRVLNILTFPVCLWAWLYPHPYELAVATTLLLPWVAVYVTARYKGVVVINQKSRNDPHPNVGLPFIVPGLMLVPRVIIDMPPLTWQKPVLLGALVAGFLAYAAYVVDKAIQKQRAIAFVLFMLSFAYGYGVVMETNAMFDRMPATIYLTTVTQKYITHGKSSSYHLVLAPWGPMQRGDNVTVTRSFYNDRSVGGPVCIALRSGALSIPWYSVHPCE